MRDEQPPRYRFSEQRVAYENVTVDVSALPSGFPTSAQYQAHTSSTPIPPGYPQAQPGSAPLSFGYPVPYSSPTSFLPNHQANNAQSFTRARRRGTSRTPSPSRDSPTSIDTFDSSSRNMSGRLAGLSPDLAQTHQAFSDILMDPPKLDSDQQAKALDDVNAIVSSPQGQSVLIAEIDALSKASLEIDQSFDNIASLFKKVKTGGAQPRLIQDVNNLMSTWDLHHKAFVSLLWESREVAGKAQAAADDFAQDFAKFLADRDVSLQDKKVEIRGYKQKLSEDEQAAQRMSQGFADLKKSVESFRQEWERVIQKYDLNAMSNRIAELDKTVAQLSQSLNQLNQKISKLSFCLGLFSGSGIASLLAAVCPVFWGGVLLGAIGAGVSAHLRKKALNQRNEMNSKIQEAERERAELVNTVAAVQALKAGLDASTQDFAVIIDRLSAFANVWAIIRADIQAIEEKLDYADKTETRGLFITRLKTAAKLYSALSVALRRYQTVVTLNS